MDDGRDSSGCSSEAVRHVSTKDAGGHNKKHLLHAALKPREVVQQLDKFIVGQAEAKRAVAIALRNRWRRFQLNDDFRNEVIPKNILMIGPTGCGKTEIARRIAKLSQAPFIKVEATKFTEVGFHGKDVDQIISDLVEVSIDMTKKRIRQERKVDVASAVEEKIISLVGPNTECTKELMRSLLVAGSLESHRIEIEVSSGYGGNKSGSINVDVSDPNSIALDISENGMMTASGKKIQKKRMTVAEARPVIEEIEGERLMSDYDIPREAIMAVEESGIVFIDEIDKLISSGDNRGADASSEGVQRDLLPLIEGSAISTKHGNVNTDFILFIASGAFHNAKPSELLAELQGRLPIRVTLAGLSQEDLYHILTEPVTNLIQQQVNMLKSEDVELSFTDEAIKEIAKVAHETNCTVENIGARRLHTVLECIVEEISFDAPEKVGQKFVITEEYVKLRVGDLLATGDIRKYIL